jgi:hypothetical protein
MIKKLINTLEQNSSIIKFTTGIVISSLSVSYMMYDTHNYIIRKREIEIQDEYNKLIKQLLKEITKNNEEHVYYLKSNKNHNNTIQTKELE